MNPILTHIQTSAARAWDNLWTWHGRANRVEYICFRLSVLFSMFVLSRATALLSPNAGLIGTAVLDAINIFFIIALAYTQVLVSMRRLHDFGVTGKIYLAYLTLLVGSVVWFMVDSYSAYMSSTSLLEAQEVVNRMVTVQQYLLMLELAVTAFLALMPGTRGANRFGAPTGKSVRVAARPEVAQPVAAKPAAAPKAAAKTVKAAPKKAAPKAKPAAKKKPAVKAKGKKK